jgi:hypothetical protein
MTDQAIEQEIQYKGLAAPRITPDDIQANVQHVSYFTAAQGHCGAVSAAQEDDFETPIPSLGLLTFCVLVLRNGFTVTGESAYASPENLDAEIGRKIARQNAEQKIWPLMGYELKQKIFQNSLPGQGSSVGSNIPPHVQRIIAENAQNDDRIAKLDAFLSSGKAENLPSDAVGLMDDQLKIMRELSCVLAARLALMIPTE